MSIKIALLSDIHGNTTALDAVIDDLNNQKVDDYWIIGDVMMHGTGASDIFDKISQLNPSVWVKGNWDDLFLYICSKNEINIDDASDVYIAKLAIDLMNRMTQENIDFLRNRHLHTVKTINGLTFSISHNLPEQNYGHDLLPTEKQENFDAIFQSNDCDVAIYGHVHHQLMRCSELGQIIINPGSVGYPFSNRKNLRKSGYAQYAILEINSVGVLEVYFKQVVYDIEKELKLAKNLNLAYIDVYEKMLREGASKTHDRDYLKTIDKQFGYTEIVRQYLKN